MTDFNLKLSIKDKEDIVKFKNICSGANINYKNYVGKIVYTNFSNPDQYIFSSYFIRGSTAYALNLVIGGEKIFPLFSLQELDYEDIIVFYKKEDIK